MHFRLLSGGPRSSLSPCRSLSLNALPPAPHSRSELRSGTFGLSAGFRGPRVLPSSPPGCLAGSVTGSSPPSVKAEQLYLKVLSGTDLHTLPVESSLVSSLRINTQGKAASCPPPQRSLKVPVMGPSQPVRRSVALKAMSIRSPTPRRSPGRAALLLGEKDPGPSSHLQVLSHPGSEGVSKWE